jgi:hypothetical protein
MNKSSQKFKKNEIYIIIHNNNINNIKIFKFSINKNK